MSDDKTALTILTNITINTEEISNGLDILVDVPKVIDYNYNNKSFTKYFLFLLNPLEVN
jgi:acetolactate synthase small subunit